MRQTEIIKLKLKANSIREKILTMVTKAKSGHIASAFSIVETLIILYYKILNLDLNNPKWDERDRFILSKGHGCVALYAVLAEKGFFPVETLFTFCKPGSILGGHPEMQKIPGVEASTGSLGHGLSIAVGIALAGKYDKKKYRTFCLIGDGECNEGSIWEAAMFATHKKLDNLVVIVDYNKLQSSGRVEEVLSLEPFGKKWEAFGWKVKEIDGHNMQQLFHALNKIPLKKRQPTLIISHTVKGKGVSFIENVVSWHTMIPNDDEFNLAKEELKNERLSLLNNIK